MKRVLLKYNRKGMTLVELLVALMVTSIIMSAVVSLAYALGTGCDLSDETSQQQAQLRAATLRISEVIRNCKLVCGTPGTDMAIWRADDNGNNNINLPELAYIETDGGAIKLVQYSTTSGAVANYQVSITDVKNGTAKDLLKTYCKASSATLIPQCSDVVMSFDYTPPQTRFAAITFNVPVNGIKKQYEISASLRGWAGNLLNSSGLIVSQDDD